MSDGHDKDRMSAPKPNGVTRQSPMILVVSLEYDIVMRQKFNGSPQVTGLHGLTG